MRTDTEYEQAHTEALVDRNVMVRRPVTGPTDEWVATMNRRDQGHQVIRSQRDIGKERAGIYALAAIYADQDMQPETAKILRKLATATLDFS